MDLSREPDGPHRLEERAPEYRYGVVLVLMLVLVVFIIVAPSGAGSRAVALALEGLALIVAVATSRARRAVRRRRVLAGAVAALVAVGGAAAGVIPAAVDLALSATLAVAIPAALVGGLLRLIREHGVTIQAVAGALAIYLLIGLVFASAISFIAHVDSTPYYAQGTSGSEGDRVYFSFTVLTTTGFGDLTAATRLGRALTVVEMLVGQLYLVTVIGLLVGSFAGRRRA
jgi:4-amino-4-deoxy-L-arabinose transferase-like glycosyltransferase